MAAVRGADRGADWARVDVMDPGGSGTERNVSPTSVDLSRLFAAGSMRSSTRRFHQTRRARLAWRTIPRIVGELRHANVVPHSTR